MLRRGALVDRREAEALLAPYLPEFATAYEQAIRKWQETRRHYDGVPTDLTGRTRASFVFDVMTNEVERRLAPDPGVRVRRSGQTFYVTVGNRVRVRFKKFSGAALRTSVTPTAQALAWKGQALLEPEDVEQPTLVVAGYLLDATGLDFERLAVTCRLQGEDLWEPIDSYPDAPDSGATPLRRPAAPPPGPVVSPAKKEAHRPDVEGGRA